ncbi:MAG: efflux RND transporter permease subunit [Candidatus Cloacimonetes bacterium]|nr:efflux RND transporter permease subunit [Candidatus Cloacimonadota bacterium]
MSLAKFSVDNKILINMIMIIVFIYGIYTMINIPKEEMPAVDFGSFYILVTYPGVSPSEMEKLVVKPIEDGISDIQDVDYISSTTREGMATIFVSMATNANIDKAWDDLNTELDKVKDIPEDANDPILVRLNMREVNEICTVALGGDFSGNAIREIANDFKDELMNIDYISKVEIAGTREREIWIEANAEKLDNFRISLNDIMNAISLRNKNTPGGTIRFGRVEYLIRSIGEYDNTVEIGEQVIAMDEQGRAIRIQDVATINDTLEKPVTIGKLDGESAVNVNVYKKADGNIINVMKDVRKLTSEWEKRIPGLSAKVQDDGSIRVSNSINTLGSSALFGIILVFLVLFVFIGWKNALFAAWGIPFSVLLTFILMNQLDVTINNLSLFSLILVLGMIVDDAIIVLENVHRYREMGYNRREAAIEGTRQIMWPVISAVLTTIAAFSILLMMEGRMGQFMKVFPIVISVALISSLFECLVILPSHIAEFGDKKLQVHREDSRLQTWLEKAYRKLIKSALKHRLRSILIVVLAMIAAVASIFMGLVNFEFFPRHKADTLTIQLDCPVGYNLDKTNEIVSQFEQYVMRMQGKEDIEAVVTTIGQYTENHRSKKETNIAEVKIDLVELDKMQFSHDILKQNLRKFLDKLPGLYSYKMSENSRGAPTGGDIELRILGDDLDRLQYIGSYIISELEKIPGTADLETSFYEGKKEIQIYPDYDKLKFYGLSVNSVSSLIAQACYGMTISKYRGDGMDEYDIILKIREDQVDMVEKLQNLKLRSITGDLIALKDVADLRITGGYAQINHRDGKRIIEITGNATTYVDEAGNVIKRTPDEITALLKGNDLTGEPGILSNFSQNFAGYEIEYGGAAEQQKEVYNSLYLAGLIALLLIFTILATQFRSYVQPLIVMFAIPFGLIGVIFGLIITGLPFSMMTMISVVALSGIVVNDSLVLVDFVNRERERGIDRWNSLINAGAIRLRPILMTTITTIAGFAPIIFSTSETIADYKPMAVSIAFGLAFATMLTLLVIPVIYSLVDSVFYRLKMTRFQGEHKSREDCLNCPEENK